MASLADVVHNALEAHDHGASDDNLASRNLDSELQNDSHPSARFDQITKQAELEMRNGDAKPFMDHVKKEGTGAAELQLPDGTSTRRDGSKLYPQLHSEKGHLSNIRSSTLDSPPSRVGPSRSYSCQIKTYSRSPRLDSDGEHDNDPGTNPPAALTHRSYIRSSHTTSDFRGALEFLNPTQREREKEVVERRERIRQAKMDDSWNPLRRWGLTDTNFQTPTEERSFLLEYPAKELVPDREGRLQERDKDPRSEKSKENSNAIEKKASTVDRPSQFSSSKLRKTLSQSFAQSREDGKSHPAQKWNRLRSLIPALAHQSKEVSQQGQIAVQSNNVNITDELIVGGLSTLILRLWFERDEHDNRRVPVLLHRLRIRISDSLHPLNGSKAVFRIECEYANGAARWVIYRELRDFISLHTHYRFSNAFNRNVDVLPEFPRTSGSFCIVVLAN